MGNLHVEVAKLLMNLVQLNYITTSYTRFDSDEIVI